MKYNLLIILRHLISHSLVDTTSGKSIVPTLLREVQELVTVVYGNHKVRGRFPSIDALG